ncbi:hypothetical protein MG293_002254 [Ovis ammon polii]|uniref:Uncharacterized protein n=1 Tax=Ovis ammon polii TaxID=230172 RepID=A0AAD4YIP4_OVIAM|nr:hypothetical protein MG293_002254 [Ovis ammon polii]KAI4580418.1 hypothetical protein MJT46_001786 [Ovis ammon polii x Ovis aries]
MPRVCDSCRARLCRQTRDPFSDKGGPYAQRPYARPGCVQDAQGPRCLGRAVRTGSPSSLPSRLTQTQRPDQAAAGGVAVTLESSSGSRCARSACDPAPHPAPGSQSENRQVPCPHTHRSGSCFNKNKKEGVGRPERKMVQLRGGRTAVPQKGGRGALCLVPITVDRAITAILVSGADNSILAARASCIASLTGSVVHLVFILMLSKIYVARAHVLTRWGER